MTTSAIENCDRCGLRFNTSPMIVAEVKAELDRFGEYAAQMLMIEIMEPIHETHTNPLPHIGSEKTT